MHARRRLAIEREHEAKALGQGFTFLHIQNMSIKQMMIEVILRATGTYWRGHANAGKVQLRRNDCAFHDFHNLSMGSPSCI